MGAEERIERHIFNFVVNELRRYPVNKKLIEGFEAEREGIINEGGTKPLDLASDRQAQYKNSDVVSAKVMRLTMMANKVDRAKHYCTCIDDVMGLLSEEDKKLVELAYFQPYYTNDGVARVLRISLRDFYRRRNAVIEQFGIRMGLL